MIPTTSSLLPATAAKILINPTSITGTPVVNRAEDVHSLLSFLGVEPLDNNTVFRRANTPQQPMMKNGNEIGLLTRLRTCMGFVSLRRSKQKVDIKM